MTHRITRTLLATSCAAALATVAARPARADDVTIIRDRFGVPYVFGETEPAVAYGLALAQCEDNLQNTIRGLYECVGRLCEIQGRGALESDIRARTLRNAYYARQAWPRLPPELQTLVEAFCAGVNDYLAEHPDELPFPQTPIEPEQVLARWRNLRLRSALAIAMRDASLADSRTRHDPPDPRRISMLVPAQNFAARQKQAHSRFARGAVAALTSPAISPPLPGAPDPWNPLAPGKSNSWALAGSKTAAGVPMLLIDPHWATDGPLQLYEAHLYGGRLEVAGYGLSGVPLPGIGVTRGVAWTFTAGGADSSDAYLLRINPDDPNQYQFDGEWVDMDVREETIRIREGQGYQTETIVARETRHGPVFSTEGGTLYAAALPHFRLADGLVQHYRMATARTTNDFKRAIAMDRLSYFNLMWATSEGDIGYVQTGAAPLRPEGFDGSRPLPGWSSESLYHGQLPFSQLPAVENPPTGFLQNCNVAANEVTPGLAFTREDFPAGILYGHYGGYRARGMRATQLLGRLKKATLEDGRRIAFDTYVVPADEWIPIILQAYDESSRSGAANRSAHDAPMAEAVRRLRAWDRFATRESVGATVFRFWRLAASEIDPPIGRDAFRHKNTPEVRRAAITALRRASERLVELYGRVDVPWGDVKRLRRGDREWPVSGDGLGKLGMDTLRATAGSKLNAEGRIIQSGGQCVTTIVLLSDPPTLRSIVAYGQSNKRSSPHYADQAPLYSAEQLREVPWTREALEEVAQSRVTLRYAKR